MCITLKIDISLMCITFGKGDEGGGFSDEDLFEIG